MVAAVSTESPRPLNCGSSLLEAAYVRFMADVFQHKVRSLEAVETGDARMIVIAGAYRICLDRHTGLLHTEKLVPDSEPDSDGHHWSTLCNRYASKPDVSTYRWHGCDLPELKFWASQQRLLETVKLGWAQRFRWFAPHANDCYPALDTGYDQAQFRLTSELERAAARRLGNAASRMMIVKRLTGLLWNFLVDRDVLSLAIAFFGRRASLADYNLAVRHKAQLEARYRETPTLAPLIGTFIQNSPEFHAGDLELPQDILARARAALFAIKEDGDEKLTPAGWRYLAGLTPYVLHALWSSREGYSHQPGRGLNSLLNVLAAAGAEPPFALLMRLPSDVRNFHLSLPDVSRVTVKTSLARFVRLASAEAQEARRKRRLTRFIAGEYTLANDWFCTEQAEIPANATWTSIMRAQQRWHDAVQEDYRLMREADEQARLEYDEAMRETLAKNDALTWTSKLDACAVMDVKVTPLMSGAALREEGEQMGHCVGGFVHICADGDSRIFALQHQDERATLELVRRNGRKWQVGQLFGPSNSLVSEKVSAAARKVATLYQRACA